MHGRGAELASLLAPDLEAEYHVVSLPHVRTYVSCSVRDSVSRGREACAHTLCFSEGKPLRRGPLTVRTG